MGWLCEESQWKFSLVPSALVSEADEFSKASVVPVSTQETKQDETKMET